MSKAKSFVQMLWNWWPSLIRGCLTSLLIAATFFVVGLSFQSGVDRGHDNAIALNGHGQFWDAVCGILSIEKYRTGRYVCAAPATQTMKVLGLGYEPDALAVSGKTLFELLKDPVFLNGALNAAFSSPVRSGTIMVRDLGWGADAGYEDFVQLSFFLFGRNIRSLYLGFFLLLSVSTIMIAAQFYNKYFVLFTVFSFHFALFKVLALNLDDWGLSGANNPRFLATLAILPLLHAFFLIIYNIRASRPTVLMLLPQAAMMVFAAQGRATANWAILALGIYSALLIGIALWRSDGRLRNAVARCWSGAAVAVVLLCGIVLANLTTDSRMAAIGGMTRHSFWQPLYYALQLHPDWKEKYSEQHQGATGDGTSTVAVAAYIERHNLGDDTQAYLRGNKVDGFTHVGYDWYIRGAYIDFFMNDPRYVLELIIYYNAVSIARNVIGFSSQVWSSLTWPFLTIAAVVACALIILIRRGEETLAVLTAATATLILVAVLSACPMWATLVIIDSLIDPSMLFALATLMVGLWTVVSFGVLIGNSRSFIPLGYEKLATSLQRWRTKAQSRSDFPGHHVG